MLALGTKPEVQDILSMIAIIFGMVLVVMSKRDDKGKNLPGANWATQDVLGDDEEQRLIVGDKSS